MNILVTGASGFIGKHLISAISSSHNIYFAKRNQTQLDDLSLSQDQIINNELSIEELSAWMKEKKISGVVHLASLFLSQHREEDIPKLINSNIEFGTKILEAASKSNVKWFLNTGTYWQHYENAEYSPVNLYAATKQAFEVIAKYYYETTNLSFVTLKLSDTFGPNDTRKKLVNILAENAKTQELLKMSPGEQILSINYIDDVISAFTQLIELLGKEEATKYKGESFAVTSNELLPLREFVTLFEKTLNVKLNIEWGGRPYRIREVMIPWQTSKTVPGWKQKYSLAEGLAKTFK